LRRVSYHVGDIVMGNRRVIELQLASKTGHRNDKLYSKPIGQIDGIFHTTSFQGCLTLSLSEPAPNPCNLLTGLILLTATCLQQPAYRLTATCLQQPAYSNLLTGLILATCLQARREWSHLVIDRQVKLGGQLITARYARGGTCSRSREKQGSELLGMAPCS